MAARGAGGISRAGPLSLSQGWLGCAPCPLVANPEMAQRVKEAWMRPFPSACHFWANSSASEIINLKMEHLLELFIAIPFNKKA